MGPDLSRIDSHHPSEFVANCGMVGSLVPLKVLNTTQVGMGVSTVISKIRPKLVTFSDSDLSHENLDLLVLGFLRFHFRSVCHSPHPYSEHGSHEPHFLGPTAFTSG